MGQTAAVILAAGQGTRMRSAIPKVLHQIAGRPMIQWAIDAARAGGCAPMIVVVGPGAEAVVAALPPDAIAALQPSPLGTADAVRHGLLALPTEARGLADGVEDVCVAYGDHPLLSGDAFAAMIQKRRDTGAVVVLTVAHLDDPAGYGRIQRDVSGRIRGIVEEKAASPEQRRIQEVNSGQYCFDREWLARALEQVRPSATGEYYLTDLAEIARQDGRIVEFVDAPRDVEVGVNDRAQLAWAARVIRERINHRFMLGGVTIVDPTTTYIDAGVEIGADTVVHPGTTISGPTFIGERCQIGPNSIVVASRIGSDTVVQASVVERSRVDENVQIGPFSHLRPGSHVERDVELGNYAELKNTRLGAGSKMHHFSYLGDARVGTNVNVGAGTITCNYNAETAVKSRTTVGDGVAIGSDTMLVAPVTLGPNAMTGAGSVVTRDVPADTVALGVPARPVRRRRRAQSDG